MDWFNCLLQVGVVTNSLAFSFFPVGANPSKEEAAKNQTGLTGSAAVPAEVTTKVSRGAKAGGACQEKTEGTQESPSVNSLF